MIPFVCLIFGLVVMTYDLIIGFLVPSKGGSSGRGVGSSVGKGGHIKKYFSSTSMHLRCWENDL